MSTGTLQGGTEKPSALLALHHTYTFNCYKYHLHSHSPVIVTKKLTPTIARTELSTPHPSTITEVEKKYQVLQTQPLSYSTAQ